MPQVIILMGVAGSGKTTIGLRLSKILDWNFFDGDDFHSQENIEKMSQGIPLDDGDRRSWLASLNEVIRQQSHLGNSILLACSALKHDYRKQLLQNNTGVVFIYLKGSYDLIFTRMKDRSDHYMDGGLLQSQFEDLEEPATAMVIEIDQDLNSIVDQILQNLDLDRYRSKHGTKS